MPKNEVLRIRLGDLARTRRGTADAAKSDAVKLDVAKSDIVPGRRARDEKLAGTPLRGPTVLFAPAPVTSKASQSSDVGIEACLPGGEWRGSRGAVYVHERLRSEIERRRTHWGRLPEPHADLPELEIVSACGLARTLFLDLETGGLSSSPVFLAGTMHWNGEDFVLRQYFARHYGEEAALLEALAEAARGFEALVTFNGKSYDVPFLKSRAALHGVALAMPGAHLDLLHLARRRWKHELRDCRLQTLEWHVCGRRRSGDVAGDEVPGLYHDYVRRGDPYRLIPVFHHNLLDVITMAEILRALGATGPRAARGLPR